MERLIKSTTIAPLRNQVSALRKGTVGRTEYSRIAVRCGVEKRR